LKKKSIEVVRANSMPFIFCRSVRTLQRSTHHISTVKVALEGVLQQYKLSKWLQLILADSIYNISSP